MTNAIIITGPTASGKTDIAVNLALRLGGEIISCDSMQIYKYMDIGTAKPTAEEMRGVPHHMLDIVSPWEEYNVCTFQECAKQKIEEIASRGKIPILAGGTGLYVNSLVDNLQYSEDSEDDEKCQDEKYSREALEKFEQEQGRDKLFDILKKVDPEAAEIIHINNVKRVVRAIELFYATGLTQKERNKISKKRPSDINYSVYAINPQREIMYNRINRRVDIMIENGLYEEAIKVREMCVSHGGMSRTAKQAIGYKEIYSYIDGDMSLEAAIDKIKQASRNYAKRQLTWLRKAEWVNWVDVDATKSDYKEKTTELIMSKFSENTGNFT